MAELPDFTGGAPLATPEEPPVDDLMAELEALGDPVEAAAQPIERGPTAQALQGEGWFDAPVDDQVVERESRRVDGFAQSKFAEEQEKADPGLVDKLGKAFTRGGISLKQQSNTFRANNLLNALSALDEADKKAAPLDFAGGMRRAKPKAKDAAGVFAAYDYMTPEQRSKLRARYQKDLAEQIRAISARQGAIEGIPQPPEVVEALQAKTWGEFWTKFKKAPITFISVIGVESLPASAPSIAAGVAGGLIAGPVGAGLAAGSGSFGTDYTSHLISALYSEGVNVRDPEALASAFASKDLMGRVGERAKKHAAGVAALDALSAGVASKVLLPAKTLATRPLTREAANVAVQLPTQGTLGATGEVVGSLASGQEIKPGDVGAEFFGEFIGAPAEVAGMRGAAAARQQEKPGQTPPPIPPSEPTLEVQRGGEGIGIPVPGVVPNRIVTPDASMEVEATSEVVDLADLIFASGDLQPRDRSRLESDVGVRERAANLDPTRLQPGRVSDAGAPIVSADGTIISGNGRVMSIREVYTDPALKAQADAYRASLGPEAEGMAMPVRVQRLPEMEQADLKKFADLSNRPATAQMSATERAQRDAKAGGADIMGLYTGGSFTSPANREFMRAFSEQVVGSGERGAFSKDGQLTKEGEDRMSAAVLAAAYGDSELLSRMLESTDDNIRSVTGALRDASGAFTRLKQAIATGTAAKEFDISGPLAETAKRIADLRTRNIKPREFLAQQDAFSDTDPVVEALLRSFYNDDLSRPLSREKLTEVLIRYAEEAEKHAEGGLLPDQTTPQDVLAVAKRGAVEDRSESLFRPSIVGQGAPASGREVRGQADGGSSGNALYGRFQQLLAKGTTADPQAFAQQLGIDEAGLQPLIDQGIEDGLLRVNSRGQVRRTAKVGQAIPAAQPAPAPVPLEPRLPPQTRPSTLAVPTDQIIDRRIAQRERRLDRPVATVTADYAVRLEDALATPEHAEILTALRTDKAMTRADVHDLADALGVPVTKSASKEAAVQAIEARQAAAVSDNAEVDTFLAALGLQSLAPEEMPSYADLLLNWVKDAREFGFTAANEMLAEDLAVGRGFAYRITRDGEPTNLTVAGHISGDTAHISWIGGDLQKDRNTLGIAGVRELREAIRQDFPKVKRFEGNRVSGARRKASIEKSDGSVNTRQSVVLPALGSRPQPSAKAIREGIAGMVKRGEVVKIPQRVIADVHAAIDPMRAMVPEETSVAVVARIEPSGIDASIVRVVLQEADGNEHALLAPWASVERARAFNLPGRNLIGIVRYLPRSRDTTGEFDRSVAAELGHEVVHDLRSSGRLNGENWRRLLGHAKSLRLLDGAFGTYLKTVGDPYADDAADITTREAYEAYYSTREDFAEIMDQEEVTHLLEWHLRGLLLPEEIAPVRDLIDGILAGDIAAAAPDYATQVAEQMAALGATVQEFTPELDSRGFFSPSLEAAKTIPQATGTVQQMRAMLLKNGGKEKELQAVGFDKAFPDPNAKVSRQELEQYLRDNRVQLGESVHSTAEPSKGGLDAIAQQVHGRFFDDIGPLQQADVRERFMNRPRYESYSTPGGIQGSYREVVTTIPNARQRAVKDWVIKPSENEGEFDVVTPQGRAVYSTTDRADAQRYITEESGSMPVRDKGADDTYTSSHWPGITNPLLHYRTKDFPELTNADFNKVRVLDEMQSDWAQRARDQGTRNPEVAAELDRQLNEKQAEISKVNDEIAAFLSSLPANERIDVRSSGPAFEVAQIANRGNERAKDITSRHMGLVEQSMDLRNKFDGARQGVPSAPYISNTSDWVDLGLKQALIDAARDPSVTRFAWAPPSEHIRRYPALSTVVDEIGISKPDANGTRRIEMTGRAATRFTINAQGRVLDGDYAGHGLHDVVGKDMASQLLVTEGADVFDGDQLNVRTAEGVGMAKFYGDFNPDGSYTPGIVGLRLLKLVKNLDPEAAKIESTSIQVNRIDSGFDYDGLPAKKVSEKTKEVQYPSIRLTPRLREALLGGQPLFALGGKPQETPAIQTEAEHLTTDVSAFEKRLWEEGNSAETISAALFDRYGFDVPPADLVAGRVWWKLGNAPQGFAAEYVDAYQPDALQEYLAGAESGLTTPTDPQAGPEAPQTRAGGLSAQAFPRTGRNLNPVQKAQVGALWSQGLSPVQIAKQLTEEGGRYVRLTSVSDALAALGILDRGNHATRVYTPTVWTQATNAFLASEEASGLSAAQLASRIEGLIGQRITAKAVTRQRAKLRAKGADIPLQYATPATRAAAMNTGKFEWTDAALALLTDTEIDGLTAAQVAQLLNTRFGGPPLTANAVRLKKSKLAQTFNAAIGGPTDPEAWLNSFKETQDARPRSDDQLRGETDPGGREAGDRTPGTGAAPLLSEGDYRYRGRVGQPGRFDVPGLAGGAVFRGRSVNGLGENWYFTYAKEDPAFPSSKPTPDRQLKIVKGLGNWTTKAHLIERTPGNWELIGIATRRNRRRRGLAANTWAAIEADLGISLAPPGRLNRDLYRFLEKRNPALVAPYQRLANGNYYSPKQLVKLLAIHQEIANQPTEDASPQLKREIVQAQKGVAEISAVLDKLPVGTELFDPLAFAIGGTPDFLAALGARPPLQMGSATATGLEAPEQSLTDLIGEVTDALGLTSRIGRLSPGLKMQAAQLGGTLMGQFDTVTGVTRTKLPNDLQTLAHEGGHALEVRPSLRADLDALKRAHANELTATIPDLSEGFAEFFRTYVTNPVQAQQDAPKFFADFEDLLDAKEPAMLEALENVQAGVLALANASPVGILLSRIQSTVKPGRLARLRKALFEDGLRNTFADKFYGFYQASFDSKHPLKVGVQYLLGLAEANLGRPFTANEKLVLKAINDPYKLARLSEHAKVHATATLQNGIVPKGHDLPNGPSFWMALEAAFGGKARGQWNEKMALHFGGYLTARRVRAEFARVDAGERDILPDVMIERPLWDKMVTDLETAYPQFIAAADLLYQFNQNLLQLKLDNGFITPEMYADLSQRVDYAPLNRIMEDGAPSTLIRAKGTNKANMIRQQKNSSRDFINPLESIAQDVYATMARVAVNDTIRALDRLARAAGPGGGRIAERIPATDMKGTRIDVREALRLAARDAGLDADQKRALDDTLDDLFDQNVAATMFRAVPTEEKGEPIVYLWEGGVKVPIRLGDDRIGHDIFQIFSALGQDNSDTIIDTLALGAQALRFGVTKSLDYFTANILRDQIATWMLSTDFTPFVTAAKGAKGLLPGSELNQRYAAFGGLMGGIDTALTDEIGQHDVLSLRRKGFFGTPAKGRIGTVYQTTLRTLESSEALTRFGHFESAYQRALADGFTPEESAIEAAYAAHDVMDFSRRGAKVGVYARITAFLNAALQGLDAARRTMSGERDTYKSYRELATPYLKAATGQGGSLSVAEKQALPNSVRIWVKMASVGLIAGVGLAALYRDDEEAEEHNDYMRATHWFFKLGGTWVRWPKPFELAGLSNLFESTFDLVWKRDERAFEKFRASLFHTMIPPSDPNLVRFIYEQATGYDMFRGQEIVPQHLQKLPPEMQFNAYTSELGREIGKVTGLSPARIDHVISGLFGTVGRQALTLSDYAIPRLTGREPRAEKSLEDMWFLSRFTRRAGRGSLSTQAFWAQMTQSGGTYVQAAEGYKQELKFGNRRVARDMIEGLDPEPKAYAVLEGHFEEEDQDLHPLNRARQVLSVSSAIRRDMVMGRLFKEKSVKQGAYRDKDFAPERIVLSPSKQKIVNETLEDISMREARNALIVIGHPGWQHKNLMPTEGLVAELHAVSPEIAAEFAYRQANGKNKVYAFEAVKQLWPQARERILTQGEDARLADLKVKAKALSRAKHPATGGLRLFPEGQPETELFAPQPPPPGMMRLGGPKLADPRGKWEDSGTPRRAPGADSQDWVDRLPAITGSMMTPDDDAGGIIAPDVLDWQRAQPTGL